ncbi:MAG TPA: hypothetical protein VHZ95_01075, partial [Polyangiales bacterium]|nr:hypothetical protein [Polyangiales bacterium]
MSFLAELWREVSRHLELNESVRRIAPMLAGRLPVDSIVLRRFDRDPIRLTTVATASANQEQLAELAASRTECEAASAQELVRFLSAGKVVLLSPSTSALARALTPQGLRGGVMALPLTANGRPLGAALLVANPPHTLSEEHASAGQELVEPFSVAFE